MFVLCSSKVYWRSPRHSTRPMKSYITLSLLILAAHAFAQGKVAVQSGSSVTYFDQTALQSALNAAQDGDAVYLPGGTFTGPFTLDRSIQLIGAGFFPDSSSATATSIITGTFFLTSNVSGSYISGVTFAGSLQAPANTFPVISDIMFHRCNFQGSFGSPSPSSFAFGANSSALVLSESIVTNVSLNDAKNCVISSCIVSGQVTSCRQATIEFCHFTLGSPGIITGCANCTIQGNVFVSSNAGLAGTSSSTATIHHNCFVDATPTFSDGSGYANQIGVSLASIYVNYPGGGYLSTTDLHLASGSPAIGAGPGGMDCGIYGGPSPWKVGSVPSNPHIQQQFIGITTYPQGDLPVQIGCGTGPLICTG